MSVSDIANANTCSSILNFDSSGSSVDWSSTNDAVYKRLKSKKENASDVKQQKRVSFHECTPDFFNDAENESPDKDTHSFRSSASHLSRAVVDVSSFECEQEGVEIAKDSSVLGNAGIEELSVENPQKSSSSIGVELYKKLGSVNQSFQYGSEKASVMERGTPEGQEDPPLRCSISTTVSDPSQIISSDRIRISNSSPGLYLLENWVLYS